MSRSVRFMRELNGNFVALDTVPGEGRIRYQTTDSSEYLLNDDDRQALGRYGIRPTSADPHS